MFEDPLFLFVYGTLMSSCDHKMGQLLAQNGSKVEDGIFNGKIFQIDSYPGVIPSEEASDKVYGEIWQLTSPEVLEHLDAYEGYPPRAPETSEYVRRRASIRAASGKRYNCEVYLYNRDLSNATEIRDGRFKGSASGAPDR